MKNLMQSKSLGFYLSAIIAVLTVAGMMFYPSSINYYSKAELLLGIAVAAEVVYMAGGHFVKSGHWDLLSIPVAVLLAAALSMMFFFQVEQIGWCVAGLDGWNVLTAFFRAVGVLAAGLLLSVIGCFSRQNKA